MKKGNTDLFSDALKVADLTVVSATDKIAKSIGSTFTIADNKESENLFGHLLSNVLRNNSNSSHMGGTV